MSGDVQPRKRKDKKKKRDDESSHGVHITKMAGDDVHLHVHEDHGTGGHWCAKIFFFSLLTILLGLIALIILENRGLADLDTPLSESRFSNYFDGWVEEHRDEHDEHDAVQASIEEHDEHDEPFEEEEDKSEADDEDHNDEEDDEESEDHEEHDEDEDEETAEDENATIEQSNAEDEEDEQETAENATAEDDDNEENITAEEEDNEDNATAEDDDDDNKTAATEEEEEEDEENADDNEENLTAEATVEQTNEEEEEEDNNDDDANDNDVEESYEKTYEKTTEASRQQHSKANIAEEDNDPFDEEDDDGTFESLENVVDNDAEELLLLQEKARRQAAEAAKNEPPSAEIEADEEEAKAAPSWASSLAVKIGVGAALALVARLVLIRNNPNTTDEPSPEIVMKRRLTIASAEDTFPGDDDVALLPDDDYSEEEIEIEEEIEYVDEEEEIEVDEDGVELDLPAKYEPESFEKLNAMYRPKSTETLLLLPPDAVVHEDPHLTDPHLAAIDHQHHQHQPHTDKMPAIFNAPPPPPIVEAKIEYTLKATATYRTPETAETPTTSTKPHFTEVSPKTRKRATTHDLDHQRDKDELDYDEVDYDEVDYEGEEMGSEEEEDEIDNEDISDVDDAALLERLDAKYGRLPAKEYESDEDPEDATWTQIKPKEALGGGPKAHDDDDDEDFDMFEKELRRANEEMMRENYSAALKAFNTLSQKHPDKPQVFLDKAKALDQLADRERSNKLLAVALEAYKRYLTFANAIHDDQEYRATAEHCIERMRFMGYHTQAIPIHKQLIARFSDAPHFRNQLAVTLLTINRLSDAKQVLSETLSRWPLDGFAQVHYGFVLKQHDKDYKSAIIYLKAGIDSEAAGTQDGRFYFNLGDALQRLGRQAEAIAIYKRGVEHKLFPSAYQRSLYNEPHLRAQPYWSKKQTGYAQFFNKLEQNWQAIRDEGLDVLSKRSYFLDEAENLRASGYWKQFELYARGQRSSRNCQKAPITCGMIAEFRAASGCRRGQVKFSVMHPGTHVWPHCGPTNCRLRAHLGLVVPQGTRLRVAEKESSWTEGKFLIFDDSFEHEVWHNGTSMRLVLIVDVWHPDLTEAQRQSLTPL